MQLEITSSPPSEWAALAATNGSFYHDPRWIRMIAAQFGFECHCITARRDGHIVGTLALAEVPALLGPRRLVGFPFSYAAGPCATEADISGHLMLEAQRIAGERAIRRIEIKHTPQHEPPQQPGFERVRKYSAYVVPRLATEEELLSSFSASTRRAIRKATQSAVTVTTEESEAAWTEMAILQEGSAHRHGIPAPPRSFFATGCRELQQDALTELLLARDSSGRTLAGVVIYRGAREWVYAFGASAEEGSQLRPVYALLWHAMRAARIANVTFNLGRAAPEQIGLVEFKRRWGASAFPIAQDYWPLGRGIHLAPRGKGLMGIAGKVWSRLPRAIARRGSPLFRYLG